MKSVLLYNKAILSNETEDSVLLLSLGSFCPVVRAGELYREATVANRMDKIKCSKSFSSVEHKLSTSIDSPLGQRDTRGESE